MNFRQLRHFFLFISGVKGVFLCFAFVMNQYYQVNEVGLLSEDYQLLAVKFVTIFWTICTSSLSCFTVFGIVPQCAYAIYTQRTRYLKRSLVIAMSCNRRRSIK